MAKLLLEVEFLEDIYKYDEVNIIVGKRYPVEIINEYEFEFDSEKVAWDDGLYSVPLTVPYDYDPEVCRIICKGVKCIGKNE